MEVDLIRPNNLFLSFRMPAPAPAPEPPKTELQELQIKANQVTDEVST
jgi:hypothetical protein